MLLLKVLFVTGCEEEKKKLGGCRVLLVITEVLAECCTKTEKKTLYALTQPFRLPISSAVFRYHSIVLL